MREPSSGPTLPVRDKGTRADMGVLVSADRFKRARTHHYLMFWSTGGLIQDRDGVAMISCGADEAQWDDLATRARRLVVIGVPCRRCGEHLAETNEEGVAVDDLCVGCQAEREARLWEPLDVGTAYWRLEELTPGAYSPIAEQPKRAAWASSIANAPASLARSFKRLMGAASPASSLSVGEAGR